MTLTDLIAQDVPTCRPNASVAAIEPALVARGFAVVLERSHVVGLITPGMALARRHALVWDCLTPVPTLSRTTSIEEALRLFVQLQVPALPITEGGKYAGVVLHDAVMARAAADATAQRHATALRESEAKYHALVAHLPDIIFLVDDTCRIDYTNHPPVGLTAAEALSTNVLDYVQPEYQAMVRAEIAHVFRTGEPRQYEIQARGPDSTISWYETRLFRMDEHATARICLITRDITERKQYEASLVEADRAKDEFLAVLSHELLTPLVSMLGWSAEALRAGTPEMLAQAMPIVHRNAVRQKRLVDDLLDMTQLIHHKITLTFEHVDLNVQAGQAVENIRQLVEERQLRLVMESSSDPLPVHVDPARLQQCLGNLLHNSVKFTPPGGTLTVSSRRDGDQALCCVEDTGRGIPPEALPTIFQVFRQVDRDERYGGLGLGLAVAHGIITLHGGSITAESDGSDCGSRFTIALPIVDPRSGGG